MRLLTAGLLALFLLAGKAPAQDRAVPPDPSLLQRTAMEKLTRLSETLSDLSARLGKIEPGKARLLKAALQYLGEKGVEDEMQAVLEDMADRKWQDALDRMGKIQKELETLLELLLDRNKELLALLEKIRNLEELKKELGSIVKEQRSEREKSARTASLQAHRATLLDLARRLGKLEKAQRALAGRLAGNPASPGLGAKQDRLRSETLRVREEVKKAEKEHEKLTGTKAGEASVQTGKAAGAMGRAGKALAGKKPGRAKGAMEKAEDHLARARKDLEEMAKKARDKIHRLSLGEQARAQARTAGRTQSLAEKMRSQGKDAPGGKGVGEAVPHQQKASGSLGKGKPGEATPEQDKALENLEKSQKEIEEALRQARRRLQEELLRALQERIAGMLARQKQVSAATRVLHARAGEADPPPRAVRLQAGKLAKTERDLAEEGARILKILQEEGSTVVIPGIMKTVRRDLLYLAEDLGRGRTGRAVQARQGEVENLLAAVLEALKREQDQRDDESNQNQDQRENPDQPLVSRRAELKMIRILQEAVYEATLRAKILSEKDPRTAERETRRLAPRQKNIYQLTRKLANRIQKDLAEEEEGK